MIKINLILGHVPAYKSSNFQGLLASEIIYKRKRKEELNYTPQALTYYDKYIRQVWKDGRRKR